MNRFCPLGLSLALIAGPAIAQEPTKPATDTKSPATTKEAPKDGDLTEKRQRLRDADKELRDAQRAVQNAQRDAQNAQREVERAVRTQAEKTSPFRGLATKPPMQSRSPITMRTFRTQSGQAEPYGMGLAEADAVLQAQLGLPADQGLVVTRVVEKGLADQAGIKLNDVIIKLDGQPVAKVEQARAVIAKPGPSFVAVLIREGKSRDVEVARPQPKPTEAKTTTYWIGVPVAPVDATLRSHLAVLSEGEGLIATDVVADSPAAKAGVKKNDILVKFDDKPIGSQEALVELVQKSEGKESQLKVLRAGNVRLLTLTPEKRSGVAAIETFDDFKSLFDGKAPERWGAMQPYEVKINDDGTASVGSGQAVFTIQPDMAGLPFNISGRTNLSREIEAQVQKDMKALTEQIEQLRKAIEEMKKSLPVAKDPKTGMILPDPAEGFVPFYVGAFW